MRTQTPSDSRRTSSWDLALSMVDTASSYICPPATLSSTAASLSSRASAFLSAATASYQSSSTTRSTPGSPAADDTSSAARSGNQFPRSSSIPPSFDSAEAGRRTRPSRSASSSFASLAAASRSALAAVAAGAAAAARNGSSPSTSLGAASATPTGRQSTSVDAASATPTGKQHTSNHRHTTSFVPAAGAPAMPEDAALTAAAYAQSNIGASTSAMTADGDANGKLSTTSGEQQVGSRKATRSSSRRRISLSDQFRNSKAAGAGAPVYTDADHPLGPAKLEARGYHSFNCLGVPFYVNKRYRFVRELGIGAYGCVALAKDTLLDCNVAIKKVTRVFERDVLARRALREVTVLRHLSFCDNATVLLDFDASFIEFGEIYLVLSASEADLSQIIRSGQQLSDAHLQYFTAQILRGVRYMHAANIIHRDLKPGNLLVNADCALRVCDFGLARAFADRESSSTSGSGSGSGTSSRSSSRADLSAASGDASKERRGSADQLEVSRGSPRSFTTRQRRRREIPTSREGSPSAMDMAEGLISTTGSPSPSPATGDGNASATSELAELTKQMRVRTARLDFPGGPLTEYVATRWYRAPEIMLCFRKGYGPEIDMWSVGCILAELIGGRPIFAGKDYVDQIARINNVLGSPSQKTIAKVGSARAKQYVQSLPDMPKVPLARLYPNASPEALDLLDRMLTWDPADRITAEEALQHPWLKAYHESNARWIAPEPFGRFDDVELISSLPQFRSALVSEAEEMRAELAALEAEATAAASGSGLDSVPHTPTEASSNASRARGRRATVTNANSTSSSSSNEQSIEEAVEEEENEDEEDDDEEEGASDAAAREGEGLDANTDMTVHAGSSTSGSVMTRSTSGQGHGTSAASYCSSTTTPFSARSMDADGDTDPTSPSACPSHGSSAFAAKRKSISSEASSSAREDGECQLTASALINGGASSSAKAGEDGTTGDATARGGYVQMSQRRLAAELLQEDAPKRSYRRRALSNCDPLSKREGGARLARTGSFSTLFRADGVTLYEGFPDHGTDLVRRPRMEADYSGEDNVSDEGLEPVLSTGTEDKAALPKDGEVEEEEEGESQWPQPVQVHFLNEEHTWSPDSTTLVRSRRQSSARSSISLLSGFGGGLAAFSSANGSSAASIAAAAAAALIKRASPVGKKEGGAGAEGSDAASEQKEAEGMASHNSSTRQSSQGTITGLDAILGEISSTSEETNTATAQEKEEQQQPVAEPVPAA